VENDVIGLIGTELGEADNELIQKTFLNKISKVYGAVLGMETAQGFPFPFISFRKNTPKATMITRQTLRSTLNSTRKPSNASSLWGSNAVLTSWEVWRRCCSSHPFLRRYR